MGKRIVSSKNGVGTTGYHIQKMKLDSSYHIKKCTENESNLTIRAKSTKLLKENRNKSS